MTCSPKLNFQTEVEKAKLKCEYYTAKPALRIFPIKVEMLSESPLILKFHDVLSETNIQTLLSSADKLERSAVLDNVSEDDSKNYVSAVRTSVESRIQNPMWRLTKLIEDITGLVVAPWTASESYLVAQYAFGGHYDCHLDSVSSIRCSIEEP
jgi:prolyl 4-hydroxylase